MKQTPLFVGTYTDTIYTILLDPEAGKLSLQNKAVICPNPSFITVRDHRLYATGEIAGQAMTAVCQIGKDGALRQLQQAFAPGMESCQLSLRPDGEALYLANYGSGSVGGFFLGEDGNPSQTILPVSHVGSGPILERQSHPHVHSITFSPDGKFFLAADLGTDQLLLYRSDLHTGEISPHPIQPVIDLPPGSGPRHFTFHPNGGMGCLVTELSNQIFVFHYDAKEETLQLYQVLSCLPSYFYGRSQAADLHFSPDGRFLYVSNRGFDSIAVFDVWNGHTLSTAKRFYPCGGRCPRNFYLHPSGRWLVVANEYSGSVALLHRNPLDGGLGPISDHIAIPSPSCIAGLSA